MDHEFYIDRLSAYFDGELKHEEEFIVEEHIKDCPECQKILADLRKFDEMVEAHSELGEDDYWEKSAQKIEAAISGEKRTEVVELKTKKATDWLRWKIVGSVAAAAVLVFIAVNYVDIQKNVEQKMSAPQSIKRDSTPVDKLLGEVSGVETTISDSGKKEVFVRGGRAGETSYIVDGVTAEEADKDQVDNELTEKGETDIAASPAPTAADDFAAKEKSKEIITQKSESVSKEQIVAEAKKSGRSKSAAAEPKLAQTVAPSEVAVPEGVDETLSLNKLLSQIPIIEQELTLDQWRAKADSLTAELDEINKRNKYRTSRSNKYDVTSDDVSEVLLEDQLVDCYYNIGRMTEDIEEYLKAVLMLKSYKESTSETLAVKATQHLDKLLELNRFKKEISDSLK